MLNLCFNVKILLAIVIFYGFLSSGDAGVCWLKRMGNGKCKNAYSKNITWEECCGGSSKGAGFTQHELSEVEFFFAIAIDDGATCATCIETCENSNCGPNKRCVIRKGRPKCICAPLCKASKEMKNNRNKNLLSNNDKNKNNLINSKPNLNFRNNNLHKNIQNQRKRLKLQENSSDMLSSGISSINLMNSGNNLIKSDNMFLNNHKNLNNVRHKNRKINRNHNNNTNNKLVRNSEIFSNKKIKNKNNLTEILNFSEQNQNQLSEVKIRRNKSKFSNFDRTLHSRTVKNKRFFKNNSSSSNNVTTDLSENIDLKDRIRTGYFKSNDSSDRIFRNQGTEMLDGYLMDRNDHGPFLNPVCGTDGRTYKTECQLKKRACRQDNNQLLIAYRGHCQTSCRNVKCAVDKHCLEDQNSIPHCVTCIRKCPAEDTISLAKQVCGVDGKTYPSLCHLKHKGCTIGRAIAVAYRGPCIDVANCDTVRCKDRQICLTDLITQKPRCVSCSFKCPRKKRPQGTGIENVKICGTNNSTYYSWCHMKKDSCHTKFFIDVKHTGQCRRGADDPTI